MRPLSKVAPDWWDYTTLDREILDDAARLSADDLLGLAREGFAVKFYDTLEDFYLAEALEYITAWQQATRRPAGRHLRSDRADRAIAAGGPAGERTESESAALPFLGHGRMGHRRPRGAGGFSAELRPGRPRAVLQPHSARAADAARASCTFPGIDSAAYSRSFDQARCVVMQGGQGEVKHWAFNDPPRRAGAYQDAAAVAGRVSQAGHAAGRAAPDDDHSERPHLGRRRGDRTCRRRRSASGRSKPGRPRRFRSGTPAAHDNPFGLRLTTLMISKRIPDSAVPMSLLADHPNVQFNFFRGGIGTCAAEMH